MEWITIDNIAQHEGQTVELRGWIANRRSSGKIRFVQLRDGHGAIQCVVMADRVPQEAFDLADRVPYESSVIVWGEVKKDPRSPVGYEITTNDIKLVSEAADTPFRRRTTGWGFSWIIATCG